jgi:hypothetical protein
MLYQSVGRSKYKVKVCMTYNGQVSCKVASAETEQGALRTARDGACADIAGGVTDTVNCQNTTPQSTVWITRP